MKEKRNKRSGGEWSRSGEVIGKERKGKERKGKERKGKERRR